MENAELYASSSSLQQQLVSKVLRQLWPSLDWDCAHGAVLDVGCGAGDITAQELLPRLPADVGVVASDLSPIMLAKAVSRYAGPRICFCRLDIGTHQLKETNVWRLGPYPKVFSFFCLHWVLDQRLALENINNLLNPGGETVLIIVSQSKLFTMYETLANSRRWGPFMQDLEQFVTPYQHSEDPEDDLRTYLHDAGFSVKACDHHVDISYTSLEEQDIINTITAINPFVDKLPEELQESFIRDSVKEGYKNGMLVKRRTSSRTTYSFRYSALVAHGIKA